MANNTIKEYVLTKDGKEVLCCTNDIAIIRYIHQHHSFSCEWALKYEGYYRKG